MKPTIGRIVWFRTDGRNGLVYDLPAIITVTEETHPGDYPDGRANPLPVPHGTDVHLTVFTPGGFGTTIAGQRPDSDEEFIGAPAIVPGSGSYVEWNVPFCGAESAVAALHPPARSWRWPERVEG